MNDGKMEHKAEPVFSQHPAGAKDQKRGGHALVTLRDPTLPKLPLTF